MAMRINPHIARHKVAKTKNYVKLQPYSNLFHAMGQTEDLLQELVNLKKEEMHRTRSYRWSKFLMSFIPMIIFLVLTIWGSIVAWDKLSGMIDQMPAQIQEQLKGKLGL
jgi:hypothetical protein